MSGASRGPDRAPWPDWVPLSVRHYLAHSVWGASIRDLARRAEVHPSTVQRQLRRWDAARIDPLIDDACTRMEMALSKTAARSERNEAMSAPMRGSGMIPEDAELDREARRVLRRLLEPGSVLALSPEMDKAVVLRETNGEPVRTAVVERKIVEAMALKEWVKLVSSGKVRRYAITTMGKAALKRMLAARGDAPIDGAKAPGFAEAQSVFAAQHRVWEDREIPAGPSAQVERLRANVAESPLAMLARRRGADGQPFLAAELVAAGEQLREDFELSQMGPRVAQNWDRFLMGGVRGDFGSGDGGSGGPDAARQRVAEALRELGPGLGDVALRCCCYLEGLETAERLLGWSARSGKVVLKIALQRLRQHYDRRYGKHGPLIG